MRKPSVLTVEEAILGLPIKVEDQFKKEDDDIYYGSMDLNTSSGWPYTTVRYKKEYSVKGNSKTEWIQVRHEGDTHILEKIHDKILEDHNINMEIRRKGIPAINVFQDCLKDEKRKISKVLSEGGTRLFSMPNIEGTIALRRYTLDLINHLRKNRINNC